VPTPRFRKYSTTRSSVAVPKPSSLVAPVDEQLPEKVGDVVGAVDLVGDHHEPHRRLLVVDRPIEGPRVGLRRCLENRFADTADEAPLTRRYGERLDRLPIRVGDRPERDHRLRLEQRLM
jgi:hypothetical protein